MKITLGRVKMNKDGTCRSGYKLVRGGKSRRASCVSKKRALSGRLGSRGRGRKGRRMGKKY